MFSQLNPQLIHNLERLGLTENEAKAYVGVVSLRETTAREVHELTNVPRAKIYEVLKVLAKKGYLEIRQGSPTYFRAVDPKQVIGKIKDEFINCAIEALDQLNELSYELPKTSPVWCIQSEWGIKNRIREILSGVKEELIVFASSPEILQEFEADLKKLEKTCRLTFIVNELDRFKLLPFEFRETTKEFSDFMNNIVIDGLQYDEQFFMIADGKESIGVHSAGNKREAVVIKLPVVCYLQKMIYNRVLEPSFIKKDLNSV
ncbi:transcriptional regulator [Methanosarcina sp. 2.H.T.1A.6]|uniref:TrmB family transcriptional regulator n=1 Tax=unclassified Methanosarcina TaxID=2644672 RepID=UPI0006210271|nr:MULTISPECIES: TrmB family transcriptional regulator [unclassified Methanosarcina]KKG16230.1 transcriptional regulator [Methanosarcina sp. 2.H.T.1A.3]KKG23050.1 transcriptional regulator [Methanosarcina sp. 2.H.T.1A.6]KKG24011.1 transcriptional regulator [Methanosarcina sp. 2.H.T.1A.15]KKG26273.1 transcriptional regulator [Methanosarcina sp. 2.H.T.1A.8]